MTALYLTAKRLLLSLAIVCLSCIAWAQNISGAIRVDQGTPAGLKQISLAQISPELQKKAAKLAAVNDYKPGRDWVDTVKYWTDEKGLYAVSFINSSYEYTTVVFNRQGKWLQTTTYLNPEFRETQRIIDALGEKDYRSPSLTSPIGAIIRYKTVQDTWYEASSYETRSPEKTVLVVLDKKFRITGLRK
jgi:hypothetical protein